MSQVAVLDPGDCDKNRGCILGAGHTGPCKLENEKKDMSTSTTTPNITAAQVKELRDKTGAPMGDCKQALVASTGDLEKAIDWLRKKGVATAAKKATRVTSARSLYSSIPAGGKIGGLVEVNCEHELLAAP